MMELREREENYRQEDSRDRFFAHGVQYFSKLKAELVRGISSAVSQEITFHCFRVAFIMYSTRSLFKDYSGIIRLASEEVCFPMFSYPNSYSFLVRGAFLYTI